MAVAILATTAGAADTMPTVDHIGIIASFISRLNLIQNIQIHYEFDRSRTPVPEILNMVIPFGNGRSIKIDNQMTTYHRYFSFLSGRVLFREVPTDQTIAAAKQNRTDAPEMTRIFTEDKVEELALHLFSSRPAGSILDHADYPEDSFMDVALGLRLYRAGSWLRPDDFKQALVTGGNDGQPVLEIKDSSGCRHRWTLDMSKRAAPVAYSRVDPDGTVRLTFECSDFLERGGVFVPNHLVGKRFSFRKLPGGKPPEPWVNETNTATVTDCHVGDPANDEDVYKMIWPKGTGLVDDRIGKTFSIQSADRTLTDRDIYNYILNDATKPATEPAAAK
jgi:hypothetical protein